jgi:uncharacterized delta-60 repeat protein
MYRGEELGASRMARRSALLEKSFKPVLESLETRRLMSVGMLDNNFSGDGHVEEAFSDLGYDMAVGFAVANQLDGKVVVAATVFQGGNSVVGVIRYTPEGELDPTFDGDGRAIISINNQETVEDVIVRDSGEILLVGSTQSTSSDLFVISLTDTGALNSTFGGGVVVYDNSGGSEMGHKGALGSDGALYVAGEADFSTTFVAKFNTTGIDTTFGTAGVSYFNTFGSFTTARSIDVNASGIYVGISSNAQGIIAKLDASGAPDTTYAGDGTLELTPEEDISAITLDSAGRVVAVGSVTTTDLSTFVTTVDLGVLRATTSGTLDSTFGTDGRTVVDAAAEGGIFQGMGLDIDSTGKIVAVGYRDGDIGVVRLNSDGSADNAFGTDGLVVTDLGGFEIPAEVAIDGSDNIVVTGGMDSAATTLRYIGAEAVTPPPGPVHYDENDNLVIDGTEDADVVLVQAASGGVNVTTGTIVNQFYALMTGKNIQVNGGAGNDSITLASDVTFASIIDAGDGNDTVQGGAGADSINAGAGNDLVTGGDGDDFIAGGAGADAIGGQGGNDIILGQDGSDVLSGGAGRDFLAGGLGIDLISGDAEEDIVVGGTTSLTDAQLLQVRAIWTSAQTYTQRVNTLKAGLLAPANVSDDALIDILAGGSGTDWFLFNNDGGLLNRDLIVDRAAAEIRTDID